MSREKFEEEGAALKMYGIVNTSLLHFKLQSKTKIKLKINQKQYENADEVKANRSTLPKMTLKLLKRAYSS